MTIPWFSESVRQSQEFQSALVRLALWLVVFVFLGAGGLAGTFEVPWTLYLALFGVHLLWFLGLLWHVVRWPAFSAARSCGAIFADLSAITLVIYLSGEPLGPLYLVYILSFLSQGTRFGRTNLTIASVGSVCCYGLIATVMGAWEARAMDTAFVLGALVVLPLYQDSLLRNLRQARAAAEDAKRARGEFLATMTHELRTPLAGVTGMARLLQRSDLDPDQQAHADSICSAADTLQTLVGDILDFSKIDAGTLELADDWFDLRVTLLEVCRNLAQPALDKHVELVCCIDVDLPAMVRGDSVRLQQILYNLVGNAVKFTVNGRVCVEADRCGGTDSLAGPHVLFRIGDTGIGIPQEQLDCIFDTFWQADVSTSRRYGGTGLGTTIAQRLVHAMGGAIEARSVEGEGTTFDVHLPLLGTQTSEQEAPRPPGILDGRQVVVCEPDPEGLDALVAACSAAGVISHACTSPAELEAWVRAHHAQVAPDMALIADCPAGDDLPSKAGQLRRLAGAEVPVVYLRYRGRRTGARDPQAATVTKPFHPVELWHAMASLLGSDDWPPAPDAAEATRGERPEACAAPARILVAEDDPVNARLVRTVLEDAGHEVRLVGDGAEALAAVADDAYDLALVDMRMPDMDGVAFARAVRARERAEEHLPIVALTASAAAQAQAECLAAGMDDFLAKPVEPSMLERLLRQLSPG